MATFGAHPRAGGHSAVHGLRPTATPPRTWELGTPTLGEQGSVTPLAFPKLPCRRQQSRAQTLEHLLEPLPWSHVGPRRCRRGLVVGQRVGWNRA